MTSMRYWAVSLQVGCFGILIWSKMHLAFLSISWYHLILHHFLKLPLIFWQTSNIFQVERRFWSFWLILVFSTMGRGLECFFRMRYHIFPRVTILVTTHVTIFLWEFCTISNAVALLVHYQMCYCVPYRTFSVKQVHISFSTSIRYLILLWSFFKKQVY